MLRTIIIDDEAPMRQTLESLLKMSCPHVKLVAKADGVKTGMAAIKKLHPDLVFLDIKMGDGTGFDLLKQLDTVDFKVIFITAYDQFAVKAFKFSALDYILKPVDPDDLAEAVHKAEKLVVKELSIQLGALEDHMVPGDRSGKKIILRTFDSVHLVNTREIVYCESDESYTVFYLLNGNKILVSNRLKEYDEMLNEYGFFRVHKSYLITSRKREQLLELFDRISGA